MNNKDLKCFKWGALGAIAVLIFLYLCLVLFGMMQLRMYEGNACVLFLSEKYSLYHTDLKFVNNVIYMGEIPYCIDFKNKEIQFIDCNENNHCIINEHSFKYAGQYGVTK